MRWHKIDVDDQVFEYLKKRAEPFVDTPNIVLRRELLHRERRTTTETSPLSRNTENGTRSQFPVGTPVALQHILEVVRLVKEGAYRRNEATHFVARKHQVAPQTVQDKYGRQLDLTADEFDRLLAQQELAELATLLIRKFPSHGDVIRQCLQE